MRERENEINRNVQSETLMIKKEAERTEEGRRGEERERANFFMVNIYNYFRCALALLELALWYWSSKQCLLQCFTPRSIGCCLGNINEVRTVCWILWKCLRWTFYSIVDFLYGVHEMPLIHLTSCTCLLMNQMSPCSFLHALRYETSEKKSNK